MLAEPVRDICEVCDQPTELKSYTPRTPVCMSCTLEDKEQGHKKVFSLTDPKYSVRFRPFEPSL